MEMLQVLCVVSLIALDYVGRPLHMPDIVAMPPTTSHECKNCPTRFDGLYIDLSLVRQRHYSKKYSRRMIPGSRSRLNARMMFVRYRLDPPLRLDHSSMLRTITPEDARTLKKVGDSYWSWRSRGRDMEDSAVQVSMAPEV